MPFGALLGLSVDTLFPDGSEESIGEPGREALAEILVDLEEEPVVKVYIDWSSA